MYDAIIIGAGPAGLITARHLNEGGLKTLVLEEDKEVGKPVNCAGLFSVTGLERLDLKPGDFILNRVKGSHFFSKNGNTAEIGGIGDKAYVVDRAAFDSHIAELYSGELRLRERCIDIKKEIAGYELKTEKGSERCEKLIIATGHSQLPLKLGFGVSENFIDSIQYEIEGVEIDENFVELYFGTIAPGFFAWMIPTSDSCARVGLGALDASKRPIEYINEFLSHLKKEGKIRGHSKVISKGGGIIPLYDSSLALQIGDAYLVGDVATQVKATTGGGVMMGGLAAKALADSVLKGTEYTANLAEVNKELKMHMLARRIMNRFGDEQYSHMMDFLRRDDIRGILEKSGDMDFIRPLIHEFMKNPKSMGGLAKLFMGGLV